MFTPTWTSLSTAVRSAEEETSEHRRSTAIKMGQTYSEALFALVEILNSTKNRTTGVCFIQNKEKEKLIDYILLFWNFDLVLRFVAQH